MTPQLPGEIAEIDALDIFELIAVALLALLELTVAAHGLGFVAVAITLIAITLAGGTRVVEPDAELRQTHESAVATASRRAAAAFGADWTTLDAGVEATTTDDAHRKTNREQEITEGHGGKDTKPPP
jgi:hypothetical protein